MDCECEIGHAPASLVALRALRIPPPDVRRYSPCTKEVERGDGTWQRSGPARLTWTWRAIGADAAYSLIRHVFATETAAYADCYAWSDTQDGWRHGVPDWRLFHVIAKRPKADGDDGLPIEQIGGVLEDWSLHMRVMEAGRDATSFGSF